MGRPTLMRRLVSPSSRPIAVRTCDDSPDALVHAELVETQMSSPSAASSASPAAPGTLTLRLFGRRRSRTRDRIGPVQQHRRKRLPQRQPEPVAHARAACAGRSRGRRTPAPPHRPGRRCQARSACRCEGRLRGRRHRAAARACTACARRARRRPSGPYILCPLIDSRSTCMACTSTGTLPNDCVASVCSSTPRARHSAPMAAMSWITPISLLACISDTSTVSGRRARLDVGNRQRTISWPPAGT